MDIFGFLRPKPTISDEDVKVSSVPALSLIGNIPLGNPKRVPVPGLDVALGVTAYQIAETAREIAAQTGLSEETAVAKAIEGALQAAEGIGPEVAARVRDALPK